MRRFSLALLALVGSLVITLIVFGVPVGEGLRLISQGAFSNPAGWTRSLVRACPLTLCSLGMVLAWRGGMYNVGGEGQYIAGGLAGAAIARSVPYGLGPAPLLVASFLGGAVLAGLAGWLHARRGVQSVISTILLNFIMVQVLDWLLHGPLQEAKRQIPQTDRLPVALTLARFDPRLDLHAGIAVAVLASILCWLYLARTVGGFHLRVTGSNPRAGAVHGIDTPRVQVTAMALSGGLCGLAGGVDLTGLTGYVGTGFAQGWGFLAIPVALLGGLAPLGAAACSLYFGGLIAGCENLARFSKVGTPIVYVVQAVAVLAFIAALERTKWRQTHGRPVV